MSEGIERVGVVGASGYSGSVAARLVTGNVKTVLAEFDAGALVGDVADDALSGRAMFVDLGDAAVNHLFARVLASVQHRSTSHREVGPYAAMRDVKARHGQKTGKCGVNVNRTSPGY